MSYIRTTMLTLGMLSLLAIGACAEQAEDTAATNTADTADTADTQEQAPYGRGDIDASNRSSNFDDIEAHVRLETRYAFSDELSALQIDTDVRDGTAYLSGEVRSEAERALAEEEAANIEGIRSVRNDIRVVSGEDEETLAESLASTADDARITATVKSRLLASENTAGLQINVNTDEQVVTLKGDVSDDAERELAELIAANTSGVKNVRNQLNVKAD